MTGWRPAVGTPAGPRPFDRFLAAEPPECRAAWYALGEIAEECGTDIAKLPRRLALGALPMSAHGRARELYLRLAAAGSLERLCGSTPVDLEDIGSGSESTASILLPPIDQKELR